MIRILSWNIQNGKGCDGQVSLSRIAHEIEAMGAPDVICLQEVSRGLSVFSSDERPDQMAELSDLFGGYESVFGPAIEAAGPSGRWQYGNAIFSRLPILSSCAHLLPRPADVQRKQMARQATDIVIDTERGPRRVITTHLEFHSARQRVAQAVRLRELHQEAVEEQLSPPQSEKDGPYQFVPRPVDVVMCGDFNMLPDSDEYQALIQPFSSSDRNLMDAWEKYSSGQPYPPTCGVHDRIQWPEGPHCRDYFFLAGECVTQLSRLLVNTETSASDHQPLMIELS
ncbi:MAG: hypothetical protein HOD23_06565 [Proteobacteria bacterium]|nr:hypothetical protein [Pseudomonadota bacterium]